MVKTEINNKIHNISFDRPDSLNAFTADAAIELEAAIQNAADAKARAVVLTGEGKAFSSGGDIEAMAERNETPAEAYKRIQETLNAVIKAILSAPFPIVAKVNGDAVGAGTNIAAACDFAIAVENARFGEVFANIGLIPDSGGTFLLPQLVGLRTAKRLTMTGKLIDAIEAASMDLIDKAVPTDQLETEIEQLLETLNDMPIEALSLTKRTIHENIGRSYHDALDREAQNQVLAYGTEAHKKRVKDYLGK